MESREKVASIYDLMPKSTEKLLTSSGKDFIEKIGIDVIREVVYNVLCGGNLRDSTEMITRRRIGLLNASTFMMFLKGSINNKKFAKKLPNFSAEELKKKPRKEKRWVLEWLLGLTDKAFQNVLRDKADEIDKYAKKYVGEIEQIVALCEKDYGKVSGIVKLKDGQQVEVDWNFIIQLLGTIGAQTLAIRGSEKSTYGKLFERLILGSVLTLLGFRLVSKENITDFDKVFWLSERKEKRESDATALIRAGQGVRFDIGFIGRGNPEISLDKVSRFEREIELGKQKHYMATFILVDRIGERSRIVELAKRIDASVIQMSMSYWAKLLALELKKKLKYESELTSVPDAEISKYLREKLAEVNITKFMSNEIIDEETTLEDFS